jgi:phage/plasmid primase-like uncharacterized protein
MAEIKKLPTATEDTSFREAVRSSLGYDPGVIISDGLFHRFSTNNNPNDKAGYYRFDGYAGVYGDFRSTTEGEAEFWFSIKARTKEEKAQQDRYRRKTQLQIEQNKAKSTKKAIVTWESSRDADPDHIYLRQKGVTVPGLRQKADKLVIPVYNGDGRLQAVQTIDSNGTKSFEGPLSGGYFYFGEGDDKFVISEGLATAASLHAILGVKAVVAFTANNLVKVAKTLRKKNPTAEIFIGVDDDETGTGETWAKRAAAEVGAKIASPPFNRQLYPYSKTTTDWNDYVEKYGLEKARDDFYRSIVDDYFVDWRAHAIKEKNKIVANAWSVTAALRYAPEFKGALAYDQMRHCNVLLRPLPGQSFKGVRPMDDTDAIAILLWLQNNGMPSLSLRAVWEAVEHVTREHTYNPVVEYLDSLVWDGVPRLEGWLSTYFGATSTEYVKLVGRFFMISAVARIYQPGCKVDYTLILEGAQGGTKSTAISILGGEWFSDSLPHINSKDCSQHLRGKWFIELAELASLARVSIEDTKRFLSRKKEKYRPVYGRLEVDEGRTCVFIGTTNEHAYLNDPTGGRRFWPIECGAINTKQLKADRDQLFAEAVYDYKNEARWWPEQNEELEHMSPNQKDRQEVDLWQEHVTAALVKGFNDWKATNPPAGAVYSITPGHIATQFLSLPMAQMGTSHVRRITKMLVFLGWQRSKVKRNGSFPWSPPSDWPKGWEGAQSERTSVSKGDVWERDHGQFDLESEEPPK